MTHVDAELARIRRERLAREAKLDRPNDQGHEPSGDNRSSGKSWRDGLISAADLQSKQFPPIRIVIPVIITEGVTLFAGKPKVGKSWWAFDCCIAVAGGRFVLGEIKPVQGDVLYLALEDNQRRLRRRLAKIMPGEAKWPERLSLHTEWRRVNEGGLADIEAWCGTVKQPRLVWIDVLAKIRPLTVRTREQAFAADYAALEGLQQLAGRLSLAIVVNCHLRKMASDDEPADDVSGTLGLTAAADATAVLKRTQGAFTLYLRGRDTEETELAAEFDKSSCRCQRVFSLKGIVVGLTGVEGGQLAEYLKVRSLRPFLPTDLVPVEDGTIPALIKFDPGGAAFTRHAIGFPVERFMDVCAAYSEALQQHVQRAAGFELTPRQIEIANRAAGFLRACAKTGIIALVDEATGYQYDRAQDALRLKYKLFLEEEMRKWEKTFPDQLWVEFGRLTKWQGQVHSRPKYWGKLVMELVYGYLDPDVAKWLKENAPKPMHGQNYHQWLSSQYGLKRLVEHIWMLVGMASACRSMSELRAKMAERFGRTPVQLTLYLAPPQPTAPEEKPSA
jgi:AAA domain/P63C domain